MNSSQQASLLHLAEQEPHRMHHEERTNSAPSWTRNQQYQYASLENGIPQHPVGTHGIRYSWSRGAVLRPLFFGGNGFIACLHTIFAFLKSSHPPNSRQNSITDPNQPLVSISCPTPPKQNSQKTEATQDMF